MRLTKKYLLFFDEALDSIVETHGGDEDRRNEQLDADDEVDLNTHRGYRRDKPSECIYVCVCTCACPCG